MSRSRIDLCFDSRSVVRTEPPLFEKVRIKFVLELSTGWKLISYMYPVAPVKRRRSAPVALVGVAIPLQVFSQVEFCLREER